MARVYSALSEDPETRKVEWERWRLLYQVEAWLETPMLVLGFVWLVLLVIELTQGLSPLLGDLVTVIWVLFVIDFLVRFTVAPRKLGFVRKNWLTVISLLIPALRMFRIVRVLMLARAARGLRLIKVLGSLNRGLSVLRKTMSRRGLGYVVTLSVVVLVVGAAGMFGLERGAGPEAGFGSYSESLWWTARIIMTIGPEFWPQTPEGRLLALVLALYGYAMFGYVTAAFASLFIGRDAAEAQEAKAVTVLKTEIQALRAELRERRSH